MGDTVPTQPIYQNCTFTTVIVGRNSAEAKQAKEFAKIGGHVNKPHSNNSGQQNNGGNHHNNNSGGNNHHGAGQQNGGGNHHGNNGGNHGNTGQQNNNGGNSSNNSNQQNNNSGNSNNNSGQQNSGAQTKLALLIGLNYAGTPNELSGCINDVKNMKSFLLTKGFAENNIKLITDAAGPVTVKMVTSELEKLCLNSNAFLVFHYSGHGSNRPNNDSDENEPDGLDETIYVSDGDLHDDKIRKKILKTPASSKLFMVFDSCHSGTICDLRYNLKVDRGRTKRIARDSVAYSLVENQSYAESAAQITVVSGCRDEETSADSFENGAAGGALSMNLIPLLKTSATWKKLITDLAAVMKEKNYDQNPQLSFGKNTSLDTNHPF